MDSICFIHVACLGDWRTILGEQLTALRACGAVDRVKVGFVGHSVFGPSLEDWFGLQPENIFRFGSLKEYEFPTLQKIHSYSQSTDAKLLYIHSKGVSRTCNLQQMRDWRAVMEHFVIDNASTCIEALNTHDICGINWRSEPRPHFSGNFWWANTTYLRALPVPVLRSDRSDAEFWVGSRCNVRAKCLHETGVNHYATEYPSQRYRR